MKHLISWLLLTFVLVSTAFGQVTTLDKHSGRDYKEYHLSDYNILGDSTDVTAKLQALLASLSPGAFVICDTSLVYHFTDSIPIPEGVTVVWNNSRWDFEISGATNAVQIMGDDVKLIGPGLIWVRDDGGGFTGHAGNSPAIQVGFYETGVGYSGWEIHDLTLRSEKAAGDALWITGDSHDWLLRGLIIDSLNLAKGAIGVHWGGVNLIDTGTTAASYTDMVQPTTHPHNGRIENTTVAHRTGGVASNWGIAVSAGYNITIDGAFLYNCQLGVVFVSGDYGYAMADSTKFNVDRADFFGQQSVVRNVESWNDSIGFHVTGNIPNGNLPSILDTVNVQLPVRFENCFSQGRGKDNGFRINHASGVSLVNCYATNHVIGAGVGQGANGTLIQGGAFYTNSNDGILIDGGISPLPQGTVISGAYCFDNANNGIYVFRAIDVHIKDCRFGDSTESEQGFGVLIDDQDSTKVYLSNNHVIGSASGYGYKAETDIDNIFGWFYNTINPNFVTTAILQVGAGIVDPDTLPHSLVEYEDQTGGGGADSTWENAYRGVDGEPDSAFVTLNYADGLSGTGQTNVLVDTGTADGASAFGLKTDKVGSELRIRMLLEGLGVVMAYDGDTAISIAATLGTSVDLAAEVTGELPNANVADDITASNYLPLAAGIGSPLTGLLNVNGPSIGINNTGGDRFSTLGFFEGGSGSGTYLSWDSVTNKFELSGPVDYLYIDVIDSDSLVQTKYWIQVQIGDSLGSLTDGHIPNDITIDNAAMSDSTQAILDGGVNTNDYADQSIKGDHVDSTAEDFTFSQVFKGTSAVADSQLVTKGYADGLSGSGEVNTLGDTGTFNDTEGFGLAGGKTTTVLKVKGLIEGANITIAQSGDSALTITSSGSGGGLDSSEVSTIVRDSVLHFENAFEAVLDLQDLQGAVTEGQVPNDITIDNAAFSDSTGAAIASDITLDAIATPTFSTLQELQNIFHSVGWVNGGAFLDSADGVGDVDSLYIAAGTGLIRASDLATDTNMIMFFDWEEAILGIPADTTLFIAVKYNGGTPIVYDTTADKSLMDHQQAFELGVVTNEGGVLHITFNPHSIGDHATTMIERTQGTMGIQRDNDLGGLILGETETRNLTVSAGTLYSKLNTFAIDAINLFSSGSMDRYYRAAGSGFTKEAAVTSWNNTQYDDGDGGLATLSNNKYSMQWFYLELDGSLVSLYGRAEYSVLAIAEGEAPPSTLPLRLQANQAKLIGRLLFQESNGTASEIQTVFTTSFPATAAQDHGNLGGLGDNDHTQYLLRSNFTDSVAATTTQIPSAVFADSAGTVSTDVMEHTLDTAEVLVIIQDSLPPTFWGLLINPSVLSDTIPAAPKISAPGGIVLDSIQVEISDTLASYVINFQIYTDADPSVKGSDIGTVTITNLKRATITSFTDGTLAVGESLYMGVPGTAVTWMRYTIWYHYAL